jgi:hypothetical protein
VRCSLSDVRNAFVHYKWQGEGEDRPHQKALARAIEDVEKTVTYLRRFERREVYGGKDKSAFDFVRKRAKRKA